MLRTCRDKFPNLSLVFSLSCSAVRPTNLRLNLFVISLTVHLLKRLKKKKQKIHGMGGKHRKKEQVQLPHLSGATFVDFSPGTLVSPQSKNIHV